MLEKLKCDLCDVRKIGVCRFYVVLHVAQPKFTIFYHICSELFCLLSQLFLKCTLFKCGSLHKRPDSFLFGEENQNCVDETKCNSQFFTMVIQVSYKAHTPYHASALTIFAILHEFQSSGGGFDHLL